jgi:hypothetical protein
MKTKIMSSSIISFCTIAFLVIFTCCKAVKSNQTLFEIKDGYYQSWMKSENEKGTNIFVTLINVKPGVTVDSIVFRGSKIPAFVSINGDTFKIKGILNSGIPVLEVEKKPSKLPDQIIYSYKGKRLTFFLTHLQRKEMMYYKQAN